MCVHSALTTFRRQGPGRGATAASRSVLAVLHRLDGFLRTPVPSLLQLGAGPGVRWVSCLRRRGLRRGFGKRGSPPQRNTLRRLSLVSSRTPSPGPLPSCRSSPARLPLRADVRLRSAPMSPPVGRRVPRRPRPRSRRGAASHGIQCKPGCSGHFLPRTTNRPAISDGPTHRPHERRGVAPARSPTRARTRVERTRSLAHAGSRNLRTVETVRPPRAHRTALSRPGFSWIGSRLDAHVPRQTTGFPEGDVRRPPVRAATPW